jgi:hypothetical protein
MRYFGENWDVLAFCCAVKVMAKVETPYYIYFDENTLLQCYVILDED